jgi:hypothetical protein
MRSTNCETPGIWCCVIRWSQPMFPRNISHPSLRLKSMPWKKKRNKEGNRRKKQQTKVCSCSPPRLVGCGLIAMATFQTLNVILACMRNTFPPFSVAEARGSERRLKIHNTLTCWLLRDGSTGPWSKDVETRASGLWLQCAPRDGILALMDIYKTWS